MTGSSEGDVIRRVQTEGIPGPRLRMGQSRLLAVMLALSSLLSGCGSSGSSGPLTIGNSITVLAELSTKADPMEQAKVQALLKDEIKEFKRINPQLHIRFRAVPSDRLEQELPEDFNAARAQSFSHANLSRAFSDRDRHDAHDPDATHHQCDRRDDHQGQEGGLADLIPEFKYGILGHQIEVIGLIQA